MSGLLGEADLRLFALILSPEYMRESAMAHAGHPVLGAGAAFKEVRTMLKRHLHGILARRRAQLTPEQRRLAIKELRYLIEGIGLLTRFQSVFPLDTDWRQSAAILWPDGGGVPASVPIETQGAKTDQLHRATMRAVSSMLVEEPWSNRAFLCGETWQRITPEILIPVELQPDRLRMMVIDPTGLDDQELSKRMLKRLRSMRVLLDHPITQLAYQILRSWMKQGFMASPAGATVGLCADTGVFVGYPILNWADGIPLNVSIMTPRDDQASLSITIDHRVFDGSHGGKMAVYLKSAIEKQLQGDLGWR